MKDRVDRSMGVVTLIPETLVKIHPTESLRFTNLDCVAHRNETDQIPQVILRPNL